MQGVKDLRACSTIDGFAYACGMQRQVILRDGEGSWTAIHAPVTRNDGVVGFGAISGFARSDLYAVGWQGEVWHYDGANWIECSTPINAILTGVSCAGDGRVYACGQAGTLLQGRGDQWKLLETEGMTDDLWDFCWFSGRLYLS